MGITVHINVGKAYSNRFKQDAPIHIAISSPDRTDGAVTSLCADLVLAPMVNFNRVEITCRACQSKVTNLQDLLAS